MVQIHRSYLISVGRKEAFDYLCNPENISQLFGGDINIEMLSRAKEVAENSEYSFNMTRFGLSQNVRLRVREFKKESVLSYTQVEGLFKSWRHKLIFESEDSNQTRVTDIINYELHFGLLGLLVNDVFLRRDMSRIFENRFKKAEHYFSQTKSA